MSLTGNKKHVRVLEDAQLVAPAEGWAAPVAAISGRRLEAWIRAYRRTLDERLDRFEALLERVEGDQA